ncbi:MAG: rhomboid family intramembrane serine protease [Myxococcota bacterium]|nr:rhomboid family intramembrane serine protease [Myxococcota bacterium]MEC9439959.1 rhomboid family intramembrane serine protease [Myxococcota bacterium]
MNETEQDAPLIRDYDDFKREVRFAKMLDKPVRLTWVILAINVVLFLAAWGFGEVVLHKGLGLSARVLNVGQLTFVSGMKLTEQIAAGQWWRLISSAFVHMDWSHILFNGYGLYVLGPIIEKFYGRWRWLVIYFGAAILSALASYVLNDAMSGGASGAIYGLVGASLVFGYKYRSELPERVSKALTSGMLPWVVFGIGIGFLDILPMDNAAHVGGLVSGGALALMMKSEAVADTRSKFSDLAMRALAGVLVGLTILTGVFWARDLQRCTTSEQQYLECYPQVAPALGFELITGTETSPAPSPD